MLRCVRSCGDLEWTVEGGMWKVEKDMIGWTLFASFLIGVPLHSCYPSYKQMAL